MIVASIGDSPTSSDSSVVDVTLRYNEQHESAVTPYYVSLLPALGGDSSAVFIAQGHVALLCALDAVHVRMVTGVQSLRVEHAREQGVFATPPY